jgi:hypothetical protein
MWRRASGGGGTLRTGAERQAGGAWASPAGRTERTTNGSRAGAGRLEMDDARDAGRDVCCRVGGREESSRADGGYIEGLLQRVLSSDRAVSDPSYVGRVCIKVRADGGMAMLAM